jgi:UDPglucose 6-dehydrogenase
MNEVANLCDRVGADVDFVRAGVGSDGRIGKRFLFAGVGYGGSCFPKDVSALFKTSRAYGYHFQILDAVMKVNDLQKLVMIDKLETYYGSDFSRLTFAVWGLAFKPNTDDIREAPALTIIGEMLKRGAKVKAYDPEAMGQVKAYTNLDIELVDFRYAALDGADALCIVTEWSEFRTPDFDKIKSLLKAPVIFDGRNIYDLGQMAELGFYYNSIGRGVVNKIESKKVNP